MNNLFLSLMFTLPFHYFESPRCLTIQEVIQKHFYFPVFAFITRNFGVLLRLKMCSSVSENIIL